MRPGNNKKDDNQCKSVKSAVKSLIFKDLFVSTFSTVSLSYASVLPKSQPENATRPNQVLLSESKHVIFESCSRYSILDMDSSKLIIFLLASRPKFLVASAAPVLVGSALGYEANHVASATVATSTSFNLHLFILAILSIMALHSGANLANDYFDHISGNDWLNKNPTPFSGGSRFIQKGILPPKAILLTSLTCLATGSAIGVIILLLTKSVFILIIGIIGLLGGFFYTAPPIKLGYRCIGELVIGFLFGLLPVFGSYYLHTSTIDAIPFLPACIVSILIFLVILVNEFPDVFADAAVNKRTIVVRFSVPASVWIYRTALIASFAVAAVMLTFHTMFFAGLFYLFTSPIAIIAIKVANKDDLAKPGQYRASRITVLLHTLGSLALAGGFLVSALTSTPT